MGLVQMKHSWGMWSSKPQRKPFKVASEKRISDFVPVMHPLLVLFNVTMQLGSVGILARGWVEDKGCDFLWVGWRESWLQQPHQIRLIWSGIATLRVILASTVNTWISSNYNEERGKRVLHIVRFRCLCSTPTYVKLVQCKSVKWWLAKFITLPARLCYVFMNNAFSPIWSGCTCIDVVFCLIPEEGQWWPKAREELLICSFSWPAKLHGDYTGACSTCQRV